MEQADLLADAQWARLIQDTAEHFDEVTLSRGFNYYKQGRVGRLNIKQRSSIEAAVEGTERYQVAVYLSRFAESSCSCPVDGFCKHMAAVLMEYAAQQGRSVHVLVNARANRTMSAAPPKTKQAPIPLHLQGSSPAIQRQQLTEEAGRLSELSITQWHGLFARCIGRLNRDTRNSAYAEQALEAIFSLQPKLSPILQQLYGLHAHLFVQESLLETGTTPAGQAYTAGTHIGYFTHVAVAEVDRAILLSLEEGAKRYAQETNARPGAPEEASEGASDKEKETGLEPIPQLVQTVDYLRSKMLAEPRDLFYFSHYYRIFLEQWLSGSSGSPQALSQALTDELAALEHLGSKTDIGAYEKTGVEDKASTRGMQGITGTPSVPGIRDITGTPSIQGARGITGTPSMPGTSGKADTSGPPISRYSWLTARARILLLLARDAEAWELLQEASGRTGLRQDDLSGWLDILQQIRDPQRLAQWLEHLSPLLVNSRRAMLESYFQLWEEAAAADGTTEAKMWDTLSEMLPGAGRFYGQKLFEHEQYRQWIDYQLAMGADPLDYRARDLQLIEKKEPALLLPFYHQAVERYVSHKNRDSYKKAVKLLKRLSKLYVKMKQETRWELFFASFTVRNSRLRALQEELRKGKLIS